MCATGTYSASAKQVGFIVRFSQPDNEWAGKDVEAILRVDDFRELGYEYLNYIGDGKFIRCDCCKRLVRKKSKHDGVTKYCNECKYKKQLEWSKQTYNNSKKIKNLS